MKEISIKVQNILNRFKREGIDRNKSNFKGEAVLDLMQQAECLALTAVEKFNGPLETTYFEEYARKYILGGLTMFVLNQGDISIPAASRYEYNRILDIRDEISREKNGNATISEVAAAAGVTYRTVKNAYRAAVLLKPAQRLDGLLPDEKNTFAEIIPKENDTDSVNNNIMETEMIEKFHNEINCLPYGERRVIEMVLEGLSVKEIGSKLGLDRYKISKIRKNAFMRLRGNKEVQKLFQELKAA